MEHALQVEILKELMAQLDEGRNIDAGVQYRMPTTAYVCPEVAQKEQETFFRNHPQLIGLSGDLPEPGSYMTLDDFGAPILATRDKQGNFHAFLNACRHRNAKVASEARGKKNIFLCPFHHWSYSNSGDLLKIPNEEHFGEIDKSCHGLLELPAVERHGLLWVHPDINGKLDVDELLGEELAAELGHYAIAPQKFVGQQTIDMKLNWKLANDTYGETYHFNKLHEETLGRQFFGNNQHLTHFGRHHRFVTANHGIHALREKPESEWRLEDATFVLYYLFPNVQLTLSDNSATLIRIYPDGNNPGRSVSRITLYYSQQAIDMMEAEAKKSEEMGEAFIGMEELLEMFYSTIEKEDYVMGEMQQRAAETGMLKEIIFGRNEPALHHFHTNFRDALGMPPRDAA